LRRSGIFTLALRKQGVVATSTDPGIAASLSMQASEFLSTKLVVNDKITLSQRLYGLTYMGAVASW
jgi:hypothetical protein